MKKTEEQKKADIEAKILKMTGIDFQRLIDEHSHMLYFLHSAAGNCDYWEDELDKWAKTIIDEDILYDFRRDEEIESCSYWSEWYDECEVCKEWNPVKRGVDRKFYFECGKCGSVKAAPEDENGQS